MLGERATESCSQVGTATALSLMSDWGVCASSPCVFLPERRLIVFEVFSQHMRQNRLGKRLYLSKGDIGLQAGAA